MTTMKSRSALATLDKVNNNITNINNNNTSSSSSSSNSNSNNDNSLTVEQFLTNQCDIIIADLQAHAQTLISQLKNEFQEGSEQLKSLLVSSSSKAKRLCVTLRCTEGAHSGQRFRLEPTTDNGEDSFKMGRSTGKLFKEKGVSLYKDKEISTTHAKIEVKNGQVFLTDNRSTNGTILNGVEIERLVPIRLKESDIIIMGTTELHVQITDVEDELNFASV